MLESFQRSAKHRAKNSGATRTEALKKQHHTLSVAELYHEQTCYSPRNISSFVPDPGSRPPPFRQFVSAQAIDLGVELDHREDFSGSSREQPFVHRLSRLLYHTGGITLIREGPDGPYYFRAAPSAGGLYPTEIYVAVRDVEGLPGGIHSYSVLQHQLVPLWEGDFGMDLEELCFRHAAAIRARAVLLFTAVFQRSSWRYQERAYRRILLDTGHQLGNAVAYAPREGLRVVNVAGFFDAAFNDLLFLDARSEVLLAVAPIVEEDDLRRVRINSPFALPSPRQGHDENRLTEGGVMRWLHRQSEILPSEELLERVPRRAAASRLPTPDQDLETIFLRSTQPPEIDDLSAVIRRRRSTRRFARKPISVQTLEWILRFAYEPARRYWLDSAAMRLSDCVLCDPTLLTTYVVVLRAHGMTPGIYVYRPVEGTLDLQRAGDFESRLRTACLYQNIARDCAVAIVHVADLQLAVARYGERGYRYLHLDAGHLGQRLNLAAVATRTGVSGIGGFFDGEVGALLELAPPGVTAYLTALGTPEAD